MMIGAEFTVETMTTMTDTAYAVTRRNVMREA